MLTTDDFRGPDTFSDNLMNIMPFLVWAADSNEIQGGVKAIDALESFRYILGWDKERFNTLCDIFR